MMMGNRGRRFAGTLVIRRRAVGLRRRSGRLFALLLVIGLWAAHDARAQTAPPEIALSVDRHDITVGDPIQYLLSVRYDTSANLIGPAIGNAIGPFVVLRDTILSEGAIDGNRRAYVRSLKLTAFETGTLWTPALSGELVDARGQSVAWTTDSLKIEVVSVLTDANADSADIKPLKSQYEIPISAWMWWAGGGALLILAVAAYWLWRRRRRAVVAASAPPIPPWELAFDSLASMRNDIDPASDGGRLWYFRLSEILRRYFDQRYGWTSIEETTTQVLRRLTGAPFDGTHRDRVREFFQEADRVRYAKHAARTGRPEVDWDWVRTFVESTIPMLRSEESEDGEGHLGTNDGNMAAPVNREETAT